MSMAVVLKRLHDAGVQIRRQADGHLVARPAAKVTPAMHGYLLAHGAAIADALDTEERILDVIQAMARRVDAFWPRQGGDELLSHPELADLERQINAAAAGLDLDAVRRACDEYATRAQALATTGA